MAKNSGYVFDDLPEAGELALTPLTGQGCGSEDGSLRMSGELTKGAARLLLAGMREADRAFDPIAAALVLEHVAAGRTLAEVDGTPGLPPARLVAYWRAEVPAFEQAYQAAIELRADALVAMAEDVAFTEENPKMIAAKGGLLVKLAGMRSRRYQGASTKGDGGGGRAAELSKESEDRIAALVAAAGQLRTVKVVRRDEAEDVG